MKKAAIAIVAVLLMSVGSVSGGVIPDDGFAPVWVKSEPLQKFIKNDLYGHIDGGAELFHEFGFDSLLVQNYVSGDSEMALEIYLMSEPASALGIYLMKRGEETPVAKIKTRNTGNRYQLTMVKGRCFVQVNSFSGDSALMPDMIALANASLGAIERAEFETPLDMLPEGGLVPGSERLIRGQYGLQPVFTFGEGDVLLLDGRVFGALADYAGSNGDTTTRMLIPYQNQKVAADAYKNLISHLDSYLKVLDSWETGFVFEDYRKKYGIVTLNDNVMTLQVDRSDKPVRPAPKTRGN